MNNPEKKQSNPKNNLTSGRKKPFFPLTRKNGEPVTWASILSNKRILQILSVIAAVFIWAAVSTGAAVQETKTIKNVPIEFDSSGGLYQTYGLKVVSSDADTADVMVTGPRYVISSLSASDIKVTAITTDVISAGTYSVILRSSFQNAGIDAEVVLKSAEPVNAKFDTFTSLPLTIEAEKEGTISVAAGYVLGSVSVSPATVTVDVPTSYSSVISRAVVKYSNKTSKLTNGFIIDNPITLLDADGNKINIPSVTLSANTAEVSVPVLKRKKVNAAITLLNAPDGWSKYISITPATIEIAGPADVIDMMTDCPVGSIDVSAIEKTERKTFPLSLGQNILDVNNTGFVTVDINYSKVKSKTLSINNIGFDNINDINLSGYSVTVATQVLENVKVFAPSSDYSGISSDNLRAVATLDPNSLTGGQISLRVRIVSTEGKMVWAVGTYTILVDITAKS
ncbi:MAG TPA: hypothetical protein PK854_02325 [Oscillospiraceae bacterium]|nr:hypothetical protein [Oscillospiraceae bacterium]HPS34080.1 hypothetical protein [Oscillospiraceae bacterium]